MNKSIISKYYCYHKILYKYGNYNATTCVKFTDQLKLIHCKSDQKIISFLACSLFSNWTFYWMFFKSFKLCFVYGQNKKILACTKIINQKWKFLTLDTSVLLSWILIIQKNVQWIF